MGRYIIACFGFSGCHSPVTADKKYNVFRHASWWKFRDADLTGHGQQNNENKVEKYRGDRSVWLKKKLLASRFSVLRDPYGKHLRSIWPTKVCLLAHLLRTPPTGPCAESNGEAAFHSPESICTTRSFHFPAKPEKPKRGERDHSTRRAARSEPVTSADRRQMLCRLSSDHCGWQKYGAYNSANQRFLCKPRDCEKPLWINQCNNVILYPHTQPVLRPHAHQQ